MAIDRIELKRLQRDSNCQMDKVKEVDKTSRAALIEGGTYGPALEAQLRPHGLTLRHFPQGFDGKQGTDDPDIEYPVEEGS
jgi:FAD/FMN-containing dehydrogenase